jgi:hypothetical protein
MAVEPTDAKSTPGRTAQRDLHASRPFELRIEEELESARIERNEARYVLGSLQRHGDSPESGADRTNPDIEPPAPLSDVRPGFVRRVNFHAPRD